ncbi:hypothetical protein EJ110_NYTH40430 [Nymphaea thermarum]|nr:hypothetical protein EJ110_NYTH40430 [Nymphaea thermarum]
MAHLPCFLVLTSLCSKSFKVDKFFFLFYVDAYVRGRFASLMKMYRAMSGPKHSGHNLHKIVKEKLGKRRLRETLTNVVSLLLISDCYSPLCSPLMRQRTMSQSLLPSMIHASAPLLHKLTCLLITSKQRTTPKAQQGIKTYQMVVWQQTILYWHITKEIFNGNLDFFPIKRMDIKSYVHHLSHTKLNDVRFPFFQYLYKIFWMDF